MSLIAIDPGVHRCGVAFFMDGQLQLAEYQENSYLFGNEWETSRSYRNVVVEMPRIYPGAQQRKGDLNDLLNLAAVVGRVEEKFKTAVVSRVFPQKWKGQVPKQVMNARVLSKLSDVERARILSVGAKDHNTIDAVGIGLWALGRLKGG